MATENEDSFDTELFIEEIHNLPCIWNYTTAAYTNRLEKAKAWECLCSKFYDNFEAKDKNEKNECSVKLQRKWKSLRDSYNRELKKSNTQKSGSRASKHRKYIYFENLSFLKPIAEKRATDSSLTDSWQNEDGQFNTQTSTDGNRKTSKRKMSRTTDEESELIKKLSSRLSNRVSKQELPVDHTDSDLHFLLSLYDSFKTIDSHLKLEAQIDILNVIKKYNQPHPHTYNYELFTHYNDHYSHGYNTMYKLRQHPMLSHIRPIQVEPPEFPVTSSSRVNPPEFSPNNIQPAVSPQSVSTQATDDDSILSGIFN